MLLLIFICQKITSQEYFNYNILKYDTFSLFLFFYPLEDRVEMMHWFILSIFFFHKFHWKLDDGCDNISVHQMNYWLIR